MELQQCPFCGSTNLGKGYQLGNGQAYPDLYAYHSAASGSPVELILCKDCGCVVRARVSRPELFPQYGPARQEELLQHLNTHGILLCNENKELPSLCGLGYSMENIIALIEQRQVFYCKAYKKRSTYLSVKAYQYLARCRPKKPFSPQAQTILKAMEGTDMVDKDTLRANLGMEKKAFDRAFDLLLEHLAVTAIGGKRLNPNWYGYLYCTAEVWKRGVEGLHFHGDSRKALWELVRKDMSQADFRSFAGPNPLSKSSST